MTELWNHYHRKVISYRVCLHLFWPESALVTFMISAAQASLVLSRRRQHALMCVPAAFICFTDGLKSLDIYSLKLFLLLFSVSVPQIQTLAVLCNVGSFVKSRRALFSVVLEGGEPRAVIPLAVF